MPVPADGGLIAFYSERDGNAEIYTIHADGSAETRLTQNRALDTAPDISPDGSQIVFVSDRDGNEEIYRMDSDGSNVVRLTSAPAQDSYPFWSAAGTQIIFCSKRDDGRAYEVYLMNSDGSDPTRITDSPVSEEWAYLSPDMQQIVYAVGPFPDYSLYVMDVDGSDPHQVFSSDRSAAFPKWSRDGRAIAFNHAALSGGRISGDICLVDKDGGNWRQITTTGDGLVSEDPYWSPDGRRIVFQSNRTGNFQIYVMNADGSDPIRLTNHPGNDYYPSWGQAPTLPATAVSLQKSTQEFDVRGTFQSGLGDLDGDGDLDAVLANPQRNPSQVWLNDGGGHFTNTGQRLTQYGHGVGVADFDGDGDLDAFINCHQFVSPSRVYLNDGNGTFQDSGQDLGDAEISGAELNLVDLNGDGKIDVHVMYYDPQGLPDKVYLNDGAAGFTDSGLALDEETIAWGDLNGDGNADYFGKRWGQGYVVQLNDGRGHFTTGWQMDDSQATDGAVALADMDGDGDLDALVANGFRDTGTQPGLLFWNDGDGLFTDSGQRLNGTMGAELAVGDLDADGDLDVFVSNFDLPNEVWINDGRGRLVDSGLRLGTSTHTSTKASLGDLDGDGDLDIFVGSLTGKPEIWINSTPTDTSVPTEEASLPAAPFSLTMSPQSFSSRDTFQVVLGDVDGDGDLDAVFANMGPRHSQVWLNDGSGLFVDSGQELTVQGHGAGLGDLDGDGDLDLFISCATYNAYHEPSKVYLNDGAGLFRDSGQDLGDTELSATSVNLVDIDSDGDLDAVVMYYEQPYRVYRNDGHGTFAESDPLLSSEAVLAWGDLDGDGDVDLFFKERGRGYRVMLNDDAGNLADHWQLDDRQVIWGGITLGDLDGDGDLDAMVANGDNDNSYPTIVLFNDGQGRFTDSGQQLSTTRWGETGLGDLDGDGDLDAFVANFGRPDEVWLNDGRGLFRDSGLRLSGNNPSRGCALGDLDADGDIDVFVASFGSASNVIWLNGE